MTKKTIKIKETLYKIIDYLYEDVPYIKNVVSCIFKVFYTMIIMFFWIGLKQGYFSSYFEVFVSMCLIFILTLNILKIFKLKTSGWGYICEFLLYLGTYLFIIYNTLYFYKFAVNVFISFLILGGIINVLKETRRNDKNGTV